MRRSVTVSLAVGALWLCIVSHSNAETYTVRPDGGTAEQCNGVTDAPYTGSTGGQCAWAHPFWAINGGNPPSWKINGGDTLIVRPGSYRMSFGAPNTSWCDAAYPWDCVLPALPSGADPLHPTRLLGYGWNQGCPQPPELWGTERAAHILSLEGTSNAVVACLELTDHSGCIESFCPDCSDPAAVAVRCKRDSYSYGDWAVRGIVAYDSSDVLLQDLDIHGLAHTGVHAARLSDWIVQDVRIAGNGWCGWDGDMGATTSSNSGTLTFRRWIVEWNGCAETYPGRQPDHCWDQEHHGYGDGVGTESTAGHWIIEDSIFRYNTSDGLDLLYVRENPSLIEIRRTRAYGNAGNGIKVAGPAGIENSLIIGNCGYFSGKPFAQEMSAHCRALGNSLEFSFGAGDQATVINSTITGQGDCLVAVAGDRGNLPCDGSESLTARNNIFIGHQDFLQPWESACYIWYDEENYSGTFNTDYNVVYNTKIGNVAPASHDLTQNPLVVNASLASFDGHLQFNSPAIDTGLPVGGLVPDHDLENRTRPWGAQVDRGAFEYRSAPPPAEPGNPLTALYPLLWD